MSNSRSTNYLHLAVFCLELALVICVVINFFSPTQCVNMKNCEIVILVVKCSLYVF